MQVFRRLEATACPLGLANVDTDMLIPARFMKTPRANGYGAFLLHALRFAADGTPNPECLLNSKKFANSAILICRQNFGVGSSREAAVYALQDYGIRCVIAPAFGDIFASNAVKNGVLPAMVSEDDCEWLLASLGSAADPSLAVDLEALSIQFGAETRGFSIDPVRRLQLLHGWDDLDLTRRHAGEIAAFRARRASDMPWLWRPA
jgi:3-isopropylmalate/(R)-2-methylmalate dehydratase small subunit